MLKISLAFPLSMVEVNVSSLMGPLIEHIVKCRLYPKNPYVSHWTDEIAAWIIAIRRNVNNVKTKSGKVRPELLLKWMIPFAHEDRISDILELLERTYGKSSISITSENIQDSFKRIVPMLLEKTTLTNILNELFK
jgi:hypothetical protein